MARLTFEERNKNNYTKYSDVPIKTINKYKGVLPDELLTIWQNMGYGIYEDGFIQFINPDEYEFVFDYIDKLFEPSIVFGVTALGDLLIWEGNDNWTISSDEGNRILFINEVVLTFYFVKIERNSYLCISEPSFKFLSCTKYWTKIQ